VEVTATVPDIRPYVRTACVSVAPMRIARGIQNKVLEAMAMGVPVVTTSAGLEGLACRPEEDVLVADGAEAFAAAVCRVLSDRDLARSLSRRGRAHVTERHSWERSLAALEAALVEAVAHRAEQGAVA
jgi:glycosyltransferase involved in cell wall biosynthesis